MIRYHARWVVPVIASPIRNGTVVTDGATIVYVGEPAGAPPGQDIELGDAILCPGLVNAHCHLELTVMRGFLEGLEFRDWIVRLTTAKRVVLSRDDLMDSARIGLVEGIRAGITTYADTSDSGVVFDAMLELGVRGIMYQEVFGPDPAQCDASMEELRRKVEALRPRATSLVRVGISPHAPYTVSDELFAAVAEYARTHDVPVAVHIAESAAESDLVERAAGIFADGLARRGIVLQRRGRSPIEMLDRNGLLDVRPLLIHAIRADARDVELIAARDAAVAHCPVSNAKLGHGIAPLCAMLAAGVRVGLGSDSVASNDRMDILGEAQAATLLQSVALQQPDAIEARRALELATIGGARALGLDSRIGSLEPGKAADLAAFSLGGPGVPIQDPETALVHVIRGGDATLAVVDGIPLMRDGRVAGAGAELRARVEAAAERLRAWSVTVDAGGGPVPPESPTR